MKRLRIIIVSLISMFQVACSNGSSHSDKIAYSSLETEAPNLSKPDTNWHPFVVSKDKANDFFVLCSSTGNPKLPTCIQYLFNGQIRNDNDRLYFKATITAKLFFELENGTILKGEDMDDTFGGGILASKTLSHWKPGETEQLTRLMPRKIPIAYIDYPIKHVYVRFYIETDDQINNEKNAGIIAEDDITVQWERAAEKAWRKQVDDNDYNFPKAIIGSEGRY